MAVITSVPANLNSTKSAEALARRVMATERCNPNVTNPPEPEAIKAMVERGLVVLMARDGNQPPVGFVVAGSHGVIRWLIVEPERFEEIVPQFVNEIVSRMGSCSGKVENDEMRDRLAGLGYSVEGHWVHYSLGA